MAFFRKFVDHPYLTAIAVLIGAAVVLADQVLFARLLDRPIDRSEPGVLVVNMLLTAAPFLWLAYRGSRRLLPWLAGLAFTLWLWWRWLQAGVAYQRAPDGSGVDMAFAFLMLISPALIGAVCAWIDEILKRREVADL